jgi:hypothetical protein
MSFNCTELRRVLAATAVVVFGCLGAERRAHATLGGDVASVADNQAHLGGARTVRKLASGERHELTLPSGLVVHEYVSPNGAVYAVTWTGPRMPDLRELLGPYFAQLSAGASKGRHHHVSLTHPDLVVRSAGHRGSFAGRAWVPSLLPPGVKVDASLD